MNGHHHYKATIKWTGNKWTGTDNYRSYERSYQIIIENKADMITRPQIRSRVMNAPARKIVDEAVRKVA